MYIYLLKLYIYVKIIYTLAALLNPIYTYKCIYKGFKKRCPSPSWYFWKLPLSTSEDGSMMTAKTDGNNLNDHNG